MIGQPHQDRAKPSAELMDRLSAMRLAPPGARAVTGIGERASRSSGAGMEFSEFRPYRTGDDLRHVDPRSIARGQPFTRRYVQRRQFVVTVLLDLTASMRLENSDKANLAIGLARAIGFVALAGQDRLRLIVLEGEGQVRRSPTWQGRTRTAEMFAFTQPMSAPPRDRERTTGRPSAELLTPMLAELAADSDAGSLYFIASDFWEQGAAHAMAALTAMPGTVTAFHILSGPERDPSALGQGIMRLVDAETGMERDMTLDQATLANYRTALGRHIDELAAALPGFNLLVEVNAEDDLRALCLEKLPAAGVFA